VSSSGYPYKLAVSPDQIVEEAARVYGLGLRMEGEPRFGYRSMVLWVADGESSYVLKVVYASTALRKLDQSLSTLESLVRHGVPAPTTIRCEDGELCGLILGCLTVLSTRVLGESHDTTNLAQVEAAGEILGRLHTVPLRPGTIPTIDAGSFVQTLTAKRPEFAEGISRLSEVAWSNSSGSLVHGDYRAQNLLYTGDEVAAVLDWDDLAIGSPLLDLSYALVFFQSVLRPGPQGTETMARFLKGYERHNPLAASEWGALADYLHLALLKGLDIWQDILERQPEGQIHDRVSGWVDRFLPLADGVDSLVHELCPD